MPSESRRCAYAVLRRVGEQGAYADKALQSQARGLPARERAQAMRLAYGAIQRQGTLDYLVETLAERRTARLDPPVLAALRLGLYELLYLRGAPDHAVVADAVELAKHARPAGPRERDAPVPARSGDAQRRPASARAPGRGHGLVNAVLRRAVREGPALLAGLSEETPAEAAVKHSHPRWIAELWWEHLGAGGARALMAADNEPGEVALRANTLLTDAPTLARRLAAGEEAAGAPPVRTRLDPLVPEALVLEGRFDVHASPLWREGAFIAQSRAAMLVARTLAPASGERVLDLCAAPGGKSTHLAALMGAAGEIVAVERDPARARTLARTAERLRASNVRVQVADAAVPRPEGAAFDRVLVDPPCSGLGTLQARPDLRWRMTPARLPGLERAQERILAAGAAALRPGGVLVYSTCTISPTENERRIAAFLDSHPDFSLDAEPLQTLPHRDLTAGFFIARLRREG